MSAYAAVEEIIVSDSEMETLIAKIAVLYSLIFVILTGETVSAYLFDIAEDF